MEGPLGARGGAGTHGPWSHGPMVALEGPFGLWAFGSQLRGGGQGWQGAQGPRGPRPKGPRAKGPKGAHRTSLLQKV